jgi:hypothetical protein
MAPITSVAAIISVLASIATAVPIPGPTTGGPCGINEGKQSMCKDPNFPDCAYGYPVISMMVGTPTQAIFLCQKKPS